MMSSNATTSTPLPLKLSVLYYKRTNKVHKHKGTTKEDGILTIHPPPACTVALHSGDNDDNDDNDDEEDHSAKCTTKKAKKQKWNNARKSIANGSHRRKSGVVFSAVNNDLSRRAFDTTTVEGGRLGVNEDDVLVLNGQWECQVVALLNSENNANVATAGAAMGGRKSMIMTKKPTMGSSLMVRKPMPMQRAPLSSLRNKNPLAKTSGLQSKQTAGGGGVGGGIGTKRPLQSLHRTSAMGAASATSAYGAMKKDKNGEWFLEKNDLDDDDDSEDEVTAPRPSRTDTIPASLRNNPLNKRPRTIVSAGLNNTNSTTPTNKNKPNNDFPGALGDIINVPASISTVLRPHQREGIAFLWNCVTGVNGELNRAMERSWMNNNSKGGTMDGDSEDSDEDVGKKGGGVVVPRGAVLADEMGLGKVSLFCCILLWPTHIACSLI